MNSVRTLLLTAGLLLLVGTLPACSKDDKKGDDKSQEKDKAAKKAPAKKVDEAKKAAAGDDDELDEPKKDEPKKDEPKKDEAKKDEPKNDEPKKDEAKKDEPKKDEPKSASANAGTATAAKPGPVYFGVKGVGLVKADDGEIAIAIPEHKNFKDIVAAPDGSLYVVSYRGIFKHAKGAAKGQKIGDYSSPGSVDHIALAPDGALWATSFKGVAHYDGKSWTKIEKAKLGDKVSLLNDIVVDKAGTVWVASSNAIHRREKDDSWKDEDLSAAGVDRKLFFKDLYAAPNGDLYATHSSGALKLSGGKWSALKLGKWLNSPEDAILTPDGSLHMRTFTDVLILPASGAVKKYSAKSGSFKAQRVEALTADESGRTWAATDNGVIIIAPNGDITEWAPGAFAALRGSVECIVAIGGGPAILPKPGKLETAAVTGKIIRGGEAVKDATVEICRRPSSFFKKSPCAEAPFFKSAQTDAKGVFTFKDVPLATYRFAVKVDGKWAALMRDCCSDMKANSEYDVGSITLKAK